MAAKDLSADVYERFHLYSLPDKFYIEPRDKIGAVVSNSYLEIDRISGELKLKSVADAPIPTFQAELTQIYGIFGLTRLAFGDYLIVIKKADLVGVLNGAEIYHVTQTEIIPFNKTTLHLTEKQVWHNKNFVDMIQLVLATTGFYYSTKFDLTHSLQWLSENATPNFRQLPMMERANPRFVWNRHLASPLSAIPGLAKYTLPIMHGFVGIRNCLVHGNNFKLALISRRSIHRA
uniref:SAC domain-containing protein n=1 Tax=Panagrolaimus sp. JU765 TaxID=591449 RepID=A0AC34RT61_9BILA